MLAAPGVLERPVFTVGRRQFFWRDVVERVDLDELRSGKRGGAEASEAEVDQAGVKFRYDRGLVAADEMEAWLARWEIGVAEWRDSLRRSLTCSPADDDRALWVDAVCSGALERAAADLAARAAAAEALGEPDLDRAHQALVEGAADPETLKSLVSTRQSDWLRIDCRTLVFEQAAAAREAALCIRDDGMALAEVASQAGAEVREHSLHLEDADGTLGEAVFSARTGELIGPLQLGDRFALVLVDDKVEPSLDDPEILRRAQEAARRRAIEREVVNRVTWHERV